MKESIMHVFTKREIKIREKKKILHIDIKKRQRQCFFCNFVKNCSSGDHPWRTIAKTNKICDGDACNNLSEHKL